MMILVPSEQVTSAQKDLVPSIVRIASDDSLVAAAQNGSHSAYSELCRRHRQLVFRTVFRITKNKEDSEDVLQESWTKAFLKIKTFSGKSAFSTWLTRIAINSALMLIRKRQRHFEASLDDHDSSGGGGLPEVAAPSHNPEESYIRSETQFLVRQAIQRLPPALRMAIEIRQFEEASVKDVATIMGISTVAAKSRLLRGRTALREPLRRISRGDAPTRSNNSVIRVSYNVRGQSEEPQLLGTESTQHST
jgi:RNA polymerase sigma factor (sigma-70 family)